MLFRKRVFGSYRKLGQTEIIFNVDRKIRLTRRKSISVFILPSNHFRKERERERTHRHSLREREREKEGLTDAPQPQTQQRDRTVKFASPISLFLDLPLPFEPKSTEHHHRWVWVPSTSSHSQNPTGQRRVPSRQSSNRHNPNLQPRHRLVGLAQPNWFRNQGRREARFSTVRHSQTLTWIVADLLSRRSAWSIWSLIFFFFCCGGVGGGALVVSVLCGGGFCVDSGRLSMGAGVWIVADFLI